MTVEDDQRSTVIRLGRIEPFRLGALQVQPSTRQVVCGAQRETLEPRAMQVLVALAQADGEVVTRDDLIARCWSGVVVGDNAIHQAISRLRDLAQSFGADSFRITTIPRVGYRLEAAAAVEPASPLPRAEAPSARTTPFPRLKPRTLWTVLVAATVLAVALSAAFYIGRPRPAALSVAVRGDGGPQARRLAERVEAETPRMVDGAPLDVSLDEGDGAGATWRATVTVSEDTGQTRADLRVVANSNAELLWSESFERASRDAPALATELAGRLSAVLDCARQGGGGATAADFATLRMFVSACQQLPGTTDASTLSLLRTVTERWPDNAAAWAWRAFTEAQVAHDLHDGSQASERQWQALVADARVHLDKAARLGARSGVIALGRIALLSPTDWKTRLAVADSGLSADPEFGPLYLQSAQDLQKVGRVASAVDRARHGVTLRPLDPYARGTLVYALQESGRTEPALQALIEAERVWPDSPSVQDQRVLYDIRFGDPREALRWIDEGKYNDWGTTEFYRGTMRSFLLARINPTATNVDAAMKDVAAWGRAGSPWGIQTRAYFGRVDDAFTSLESPGGAARVGAYSEVLFRPFTRSLRLDPRFMRLAARLGLTAYWRQSGRWPDFCEDHALPYECRAEAAKAERLTAGAT